MKASIPNNSLFCIFEYCCTIVLKLGRIHLITFFIKFFLAKYTWYSKVRVYLKLLIQLQHCWKAKSNFKLFSQTASSIYEQKFDLCDVLST